MSGLFPKAPSSASKINVASGELPLYVTASQAPTKKSPWRTIRGVEYNQYVTAILPDELYHLIWEKVEANITHIEYAKVIMKLEDVLKGDFFTEYIKRGNILMLSEGEAGVDNVYSLKQGVLRLELSKDSYERAGLQGKPIPSGGSKHVKLRYLIEINLRLPSMLHGKKGFDRLVWAAKHVLNQSLNWLFLDLNPNTIDISTQNTTPLSTHHPTIHTLRPSTRSLPNTLTPSTLLTIPDGVSLLSVEAHEPLCDILEYIDMLSLASPRLQATDQTHPFLSRYEVPDLSGDLDPNVSNRLGQSVKLLTWTGLIPSRWILELLCAVIRYSRTENFGVLPKQQQWLAISVSSHKTQAVNQVDGYTILLQPARNTEQPRNFHPNRLTPTTSANMDVVTQEGLQGTPHQERSEDVNMTPAPVPDKIQQTPESAPSRTGFQCYLCAEYIDSLT
ncbi:uncharacterized protein Z519_08140 [Cladophialophora bantiana CBS 173.52]|uniref:Uncharacterized protein n=1 Tax=Cladophialophora bantiana (strain ATCC 10958 / CBS 173.52 / CDC B-1940 / NIH 8579) TaxID=1442370 RepID=A0A0D2I2W0_CLAB1|nr:uncharacterized protein Z519_08140 [Cladophialophora bantiana CBS 173.52]KIW91244.1 hypothetical protein Z519_08140 [Cladophialophora bantiana CBS 173.52]